MFLRIYRKNPFKYIQKVWPYTLVLCKYTYNATHYTIQNALNDYLTFIHLYETIKHIYIVCLHGSALQSLIS